MVAKAEYFKTKSRGGETTKGEKEDKEEANEEVDDDEFDDEVVEGVRRGKTHACKYRNAKKKKSDRFKCEAAKEVKKERSK